MGTKTITMYVSDIDNSAIEEGQAYQLSIRHPDGSTQQLDISEKNYRDLKLEGLGKTLKKRGRKPGSTSRTGAAGRPRGGAPPPPAGGPPAQTARPRGPETPRNDPRANWRGRRCSGAGLAGGAHPENIRLVVGDGESVAVRDPGRPQLHPARVDLDDPATALANQMVMMDRIAEAEQRLTGFAPEHVHPARINQPLEGTVDRGQSDGTAEAGMEVLGRQRLGCLAEGVEHGRALPGDPRRLGNSAVGHGA